MKKTGKPRGKGRPFPPNNRANPLGRPKKGQGITDNLRDRVDLGQLAEVILKGAYAGDARFVAMVWDRLEGKVTDVIMNITDMFKESDVLADRTLLWLTKHHPKLVKEWAKETGVDLTT